MARKRRKRDNYHKAAETYTDFSNVETMHRYLVPEDLPEGPYGSPISASFEKTTPYDEDQRRYSNFNYEFKSLHQDTPRQYPGAHPTHDDPDFNDEPPYSH